MTRAPSEEKPQVAVEGVDGRTVTTAPVRSRVAQREKSVSEGPEASPDDAARARPRAVRGRVQMDRLRVLAVECWALVRGNKVFTAVFAAGALLRLIAMLGYRPAVWFNDSFDYLHVTMSPYPHPIRPDGYPFLLWLLKPFHSFALVAAIQHAMGLAVAVMVYALLRKKFRLPGWGATLAAAPALLDAYQIQLEHLILSDTMFDVLLVAVITLVLWYDKALTWKMGATIGLLLGVMSLTRSVGPAVLFAVVVYVLIRRIHWRVVVAIVALCALPLAGYAVWFYTWYGKFNTTMSSGIFLYSRVTSFADCNKINPPVTEVPLCKNPRTTHTPLVFAQDAIWDRHSPFHRLALGRFTSFNDQNAQDFATRAIIAQPVDYLKVVATDFLRTFKWNRDVFPDRKTYDMYQFGRRSATLPNWRMSKDTTANSEARAYEHGSAKTSIVRPYATVIRVYQKYVYLHGTPLAAILIIGPAGMVPVWRRWGGAAFLPWITATGLLILPAATAEFDYRYVLPEVPLACLAAAIAFTGEPRQRLARLVRRRGGTAERPPGGSATPGGPAKTLDRNEPDPTPA